MKTLKNLGYLFSAIGVVLLGICYPVFNHTSAFLERSVTTDGTVIAFEQRLSSSDSTVTLNYPVVSFQDDSGNAHQFESSFGSAPPKYKVGETVAIRFDPEAPEIAKIDGFVSNWLAVIVLSSLGILFLIAGGGILGVPYLVKRKHTHLKRFGTVVSMKITSVATDPNTVINGRHPWRISATWTNPKTGKACVFKSPCLMTDPSPYIRRDRIEVRIDPNKPSVYEMDLSFLPRTKENEHTGPIK